MNTNTYFGLLHRLCDPALMRVRLKSLLGREKQSLQLENFKIASPAVAYIKLNATYRRDHNDLCNFRDTCNLIALTVENRIIHSVRGELEMPQTNCIKLSA